MDQAGSEEGALPELGCAFTLRCLLAPRLVPLPAPASSVVLDKVAPVTPTPCLALFHEWRRPDASSQGLSGEEGDKAFRPLLGVGRRLTADAVIGPHDPAVKVLTLTRIGEDVGGTLRAKGILADMERIATGREQDRRAANGDGR